jgi:outer membrane protein TolC
MQEGYSDYLTDLAAAMAYGQALLNLEQAEATRFGDTAALYQALGGGWWNRNATDAHAAGGGGGSPSAVAAAN